MNAENESEDLLDLLLLIITACGYQINGTD